jgi:ABC-type lipoprotein release transport system permease subunit
VGRQLAFGSDTVTIVGVARDLHYHGLLDPPVPTTYLPLAQHVGSFVGLSAMTLVAYAPRNPDAAGSAVREALRRASTVVPVFGLGTFDDRYAALLAPQRLGALLLGCFSVLALVLSAVGIYGVVAYAVAQRTREIGIRVALGAAPGSVQRVMVRHSAAAVGVGLAVGLLLAELSGRTVEAFLYGVSATDGRALAVAVLVLGGVAALAGYLPARRAARVDPMVALRAE